jgi:hypothetical protein
METETLEKQDQVVWNGLIWLKLGTSEELLWTRQWTFGFHTMLGNSWVAERLEAYQKGLIVSSVELVMETESSQPYSQDVITSPCPEAHKSSPETSFYKIHFNTILSSMAPSSK